MMRPAAARAGDRLWETAAAGAPQRRAFGKRKMADIKYERAHQLPLAQARRIAQQAADDLARKYDLSCRWDGDTLCFARSGVDGRMQVAADRIALEVTLGFMLRPFKAALAQSIERKIDELLPPAPAAGKSAGKPAAARGAAAAPAKAASRRGGKTGAPRT